MRSFFDDYVQRVFPARRAQADADWRWPGDEWVSDITRDHTYELMASGAGALTWSQVVEIGPGSGKYTEMLLDRTDAHIVAYEISPAFLDSLALRCSAARDGGRLDARLIDWTDNQGLMRNYGDMPKADLFFAIDVFLMMDFQSVFVYLISAARMLKPGGQFFATFADFGSDSGWHRLVRDAGRHSAFDQAECTRFHWVDASALENVLTRLGFTDINMTFGTADHLDVARLYVSAQLTDPAAAIPLEGALAPAGDSTNQRSGSEND